MTLSASPGILFTSLVQLFIPSGTPGMLMRISCLWSRQRDTANHQPPSNSCDETLSEDPDFRSKGRSDSSVRMRSPVYPLGAILPSDTNSSEVSARHQTTSARGRGSSASSSPRSRQATFTRSEAFHRGCVRALQGLDRRRPLV